MAHVAIIDISDKTLLKMLLFKGGTIHRIFKREDEWRSGETCFVIEHPDLDEVEEGYALRHIAPTYTCNNGVLERIEPPILTNIDKKAIRR